VLGDVRQDRRALTGIGHAQQGGKKGAHPD